MSKTVMPSVYYAEDKDISDLLDSEKRVFNVKRLIMFARKRGVILSPQSTREELVEYLSNLTWSWAQIQEITALTETKDRADKVSSQSVSADLKIADIQEAISAVRDSRMTIGGEVFTIPASQGDKLTVKINYTEFEPSKTRLRQRTEKTLLLEVEKRADGFTFRHNANERGGEIVRDIVKTLPENAGKKLEAQTISLEGILDPMKRTQFFIELMKNIPGYDLVNVTSISVNRLGDLPSDEDNASSDDSYDIDPPPTSSRTASIPSSEADEMLGVVNKLALEGTSLLSSKQYRELREQGFFLSRAVWRSREKATKSLELEFEADFENPQNCVGFRYSVLGTYEMRKRGAETLRKTRTPVSASDRPKLLSLLEKAAKSAFTVVTADSQNASGKKQSVFKAKKDKVKRKPNPKSRGKRSQK